MEAVIFIVIVVVLCVSVLRRVQRKRRGARQVAGGAAPPSPGRDQHDAQPLSLRLHQIASGFAQFANDSAHPRDLSEQPQFKEAAELLADPGVPLQAVLQYARGANWLLSCAALAALSARSDRAGAVDEIMAHFDKLVPWAMHFALEYFLGVDPRPAAGAPVVNAKDWWRDNPFVTLMFRDYLSRRAALGDAAEFGPLLHLPSAAPYGSIKAFLERVDHPLARALSSRLEAIQRASIDRSFLITFGRLWVDQNAPDILIEPETWNENFAAAQSALQQQPPRSLLVTGEPLVGKTSFLQLLARRLSIEGWTIFEASAADLMAGQIWFGQLEGRIRRLTEEVTAVKKLIWYIPDPQQLARSGTHQGQSASILDQILPALASRQLLIFAETTPTGATRLLQMRPALRGMLEIIRLEPQSATDTLLLARSLADRLANQSGILIDPDCAEAAVSAARQYLSLSNFPGAALRLIRLTAGRTEKGGMMVPDEVPKTLSQLTGLPISILDHQEQVDLASLRKFFADRVIGQHEAVATIVDRIAMLKAGLNDPGRPIGVFLFAGPTGTGKTELAKATAEYLFGSVERLIRVDMSEFQTADSMDKIVGSGSYGEPESLISRVRKQPFSVVLLDEFEKSHPRIWDLFLQVFDEGRLTDTLGQVADFRHCLIILTTNLGATAHQSAKLGFAPPPDVFTTEQVLRAISQTYRPEFQNRLDRIIVFHPLSRDVMRVILRKELKGVLERRGLKDRAWAVEWEGSALEFLLEKGFSAEMGARPLKRAIDQYVIAPLAATIVEQRFPQGEQFVFFRSDGQAIQAEFVDPDSGAFPASPLRPAEAVGGAPTLASMILAPQGARSELDALGAETAKVEQSLSSAEWEHLKHQLSEAMAVPEFWTRPERFAALARLALMDRVAVACATATALRARLARGASESGRYSRELVSRLALQVYLLRAGITDVFEAAPVEVALLVEPALEGTGADKQATFAWCRQLFEMYRAWSRNRHMQTSELERGASGLPILLVTGFGAHRVLSRECGIHILELAEGHNANTSRLVARVQLAIPPLEELPPATLQRALAATFEKAPRPTAIIRRYRQEPAPLVRSADGSWRTGKLDAVLGGDFDLLAAEQVA